VRPAKFRHLYIKFCVLPTKTVNNVLFLTKLTIFFLFSKVPIKEKRYIFKNNIKSQICISYSAPCQISLSLLQSLCFTYSSSLKSVHPPKIPIKEIGALSKIIYNLIFHFLQCALSYFFFSRHIFFTF
jgi:hypothetical protein